jgi:HD-like signal output (HDOD) protein
MNALPEQVTPTAVDSLFERSILDIGIPPCPVVLQNFMTEARKDEPDYRRLEQLLGDDVGLSASLIKTANSPFFGLRQPVRSVYSALSILGLKTSICAVAGIVLRESFPKLRNLDRFWDGSARVSHLSGWLALELDIRGLRADDAYTYGLFRDCGIAVLLGRFPHYRKLLGLANQDAERSFTQVEETELPINHAIVGAVLSQSWWLPDEISLAIRNHHDLAALDPESSSLPPSSRSLIATAQLAEHILQQQLGLSVTAEWPKLGASCLKVLDIHEEQLEALYIDAAPIAVGRS